MGSLLNLSCESGPSSPPPRLHWFLSGVKVGREETEGSVTDMETVFPLDDKRGVSRSLLKYPLSNDNLARVPRQLVVKCVAVIKEFYRKGVKVVVEVKGRELTRQDHPGVKDKQKEDWAEDVSINNGVRSYLVQQNLILISVTLILELWY